MQSRNTLRQVVNSDRDLQADRVINVVVANIDHWANTHQVTELVVDVEGSMLQGTVLHMDRTAKAVVQKDTM